MNILFSGDENIEKGVLITVTSILEHTEDEIHIYLISASFTHEGIVHKGISEDFRAFLEGVIREKNSRSTVELFDTTHHFAGNLPDANMNTRFTPGCMLRLFADLIDAIPDKLLYLDNDIIALGDLNELYSTDISACDLAGVLDFYGSHIYKRHFFKRDYINSGVLLLNMKMIRETGLLEGCRRMCKEKKMLLPDQSAINALAKSKLKLDRKYNEQRRERGETVIRHFTTTFRIFPYPREVRCKPWDLNRVHEVWRTDRYDGTVTRGLRLYEELLQARRS